MPVQTPTELSPPFFCHPLNNLSRMKQGSCCQQEYLDLITVFVPCDAHSQFYVWYEVYVACMKLSVGMFTLFIKPHACLYAFCIFFLCRRSFLFSSNSFWLALVLHHISFTENMQTQKNTCHLEKSSFFSHLIYFFLRRQFSRYDYIRLIHAEQITVASNSTISQSHLC